MLRRTLSVVAILTAGASLALGQDAANPAAAALRAPADAGCGDCRSATRCRPDGWLGVDYLMLFPSRMHVPPVLDTGGLNPVILAGNSPDLGVSHGVRLDAGIWLCDGQIGMQTIAFGAFRSYVTASAAEGVIRLDPPFAGFGVADFSYTSWHQVAGGEGNTLYRVGDGATGLYLLAGTRFLKLEEDITIAYSGAQASRFLDQFHTRDQFFGGQIGALWSRTWDRFDVDVTAKVAIGVTYNELYILGSNTAGLTFQVLTGASNIGYYESNYLGLIPEVSARLRYRVTERLTANVGYMGLMSINAWRPGDQISLLNDGGVTQPRVAPPVRSTYFLHGLTAGFTLRY